MLTGRNRMGSADEASACCARIAVARGEIVGSWLQGGRPGSRRWTKTTVRPLLTSVVDTVSADRSPLLEVAVDPLEGHGLRDLPLEARRVEDRGAAARGRARGAPAEQVVPDPEHAAHVEAHEVVDAQARPHPGEPPRAVRASSANAASPQTLMAPTEVPHRISSGASRPRSRETSSRMCCTTPTS